MNDVLFKTKFGKRCRPEYLGMLVSIYLYNDGLSLAVSQA